MSDLIRIRREELYAKGVEEALARERQMRGRRPEPPPVSPLRAFLLSPLFYLPAAGGVAALVVWLLLNPVFEDAPHVAGEILLVNRDPFDVEGTVLTLGDIEVIVPDGPLVRFESGEDGQPPLQGSEDLEAGVVVEVLGAPDQEIAPNRVVAVAVRRASRDRALAVGTELPALWPQFALFPLTAVLVALALVVAEGVASRNWLRMVQRSISGAGLTLVFSLLAFVPAGIAMQLGLFVFESSLTEADGFVTADTMKPVPFLVFSACRSIAWACIGAALGLGLNLVRSTKVQLRNSVVGGALGGALGGAFFDPIGRFAAGESLFEAGAGISRLVGLVAVGLCVGFFVALAERLAREAWVLVRTGPLAGKSFVLYRTPTTIGSAPSGDIYLFKDAEIGPRHAAIHRIGNRYEIEDLGSGAGVSVGGRAVRRHRLASGDQIVLGATVLEFEERMQKS